MVLEALDFTYYNKVWMVIFAPLIFVFFMCVVDLNRTKLLFKVIVSNEYFYKYPFDSISSISWYHVFGFGFLTTVFGLFIMLLNYGSLNIYENLFTLFFQSLFWSLGYFFTKYLLVEFLYKSFRKESFCKQMLTLEVSYLVSFMAVLYLPICYVFLHLNDFESVVSFILVSFGVSYFIRLLILFGNKKNLLYNKTLYIILYLCALEMLPFIYLFKGYIE